MEQASIGESLNTGLARLFSETEDGAIMDKTVIDFIAHDINNPDQRIYVEDEDLLFYYEKPGFVLYQFQYYYNMQLHLLVVELLLEDGGKLLKVFEDKDNGAIENSDNSDATVFCRKVRHYLENIS